MTKDEELAAAARGDGCLGRSQPDEPVFILCARDCVAAETVRVWAMKAERLGVNAGKLAEARAHANRMDIWREVHGGGKVPD